MFLNFFAVKFRAYLYMNNSWKIVCANCGIAQFTVVQARHEGITHTPITSPSSPTKKNRTRIEPTTNLVLAAKNMRVALRFGPRTSQRDGASRYIIFPFLDARVCLPRVASTQPVKCTTKYSTSIVCRQKSQKTHNWQQLHAHNIMCGMCVFAMRLGGANSTIMGSGLSIWYFIVGSLTSQA